MSEIQFEVGKTYKTRGGDNVRVIAIDHELLQPVVGVHGVDVECWSRNGKYARDGFNCSSDLIEEVNDPMPSLYGFVEKFVAFAYDDEQTKGEDLRYFAQEIIEKARAILAERSIQ